MVMSSTLRPAASSRVASSTESRMGCENQSAYWMSTIPSSMRTSISVSGVNGCTPTKNRRCSRSSSNCSRG